jgi:predicted solute-binding protein
MIGDEALRHGPRYRNSLDLGKAWHTLTGLPFVFAVWAARAEVWTAAAEDVRAIHQALLAAKAYSRTHPEAMVALACERTGLPPEACRRYLRERLSFDLGPRHLEGLRTFLQLLVDAGDLPAVPWLHFIPA